MSKPLIRTEYWLQVKSKAGRWDDCGTDKTSIGIFKNIHQLKKSDPTKEWRCVKRTIIDEVVPEK